MTLALPCLRVSPNLPCPSRLRLPQPPSLPPTGRSLSVRLARAAHAVIKRLTAVKCSSSWGLALHESTQVTNRIGIYWGALFS